MVFVSLLAGAVLSKDAPPVDAGAGTSLEVRLVTIDVVALDKSDRTVADLQSADFEMTVDGREQAIETFDVDCAAGSLAEPVARRRPEDSIPSDEKSEAPRHIVFAIDYSHLMPPPVGSPGSLDKRDPRIPILENLRAVLANGFAPGDEFMLVAIANGLRVEHPFTSDRARLIETTRRMQNDITLWNGDFSHTTELPTFQALDVLLEVLAEIPGPKSVVLFSDGIWPNGGDRNYDPELIRLSSMAGNARVTIYPVMARGLEVQDRPTG
jgi:VWFA-related protein